MRVADAIAQILLDEGIKTLVCYPRNPLIDACASLGIRPIVCRQERVGVNIADGISRASNGRTIGVFAPQGGPGIENSFAGVAQAFGDNTPLLILCGNGHGRRYTPPTFSAVTNFAHVTKWGCQVDEPARVWEIMRRAFHALRTGKGGPVLLELIGNIAEADCGEYQYEAVAPFRSGPDPAGVLAVKEMLLAAERPVIHAGQGILWSGATAALVALAEALDIPVLTTNTGKSAFPEDHPLSLGAMVVSAPQPAFHFLDRADCVFAAGASLTRTPWGPQIAAGKKIAQLTNDAADINKEFVTHAAILSDARLGLEALIESIGVGVRRRTGVATEIAERKDAWREEFSEDFSSDEVPINHYRILGEIMKRVDLHNTVVTHEAGSPREQTVPFWLSLMPRDYIGWGKSTQLGAGLGLIMGAKIVNPAKTCINFMGDASIGMTGMDIETAVRCKIGILTIVYNNGIMAGERNGMEEASSRYDALDLGGNYAGFARALGAWSARVEDPGVFGAAFDEAVRATQTGQPAVIEVMAKVDTHFSRPPFRGQLAVR